MGIEMPESGKYDRPGPGIYLADLVYAVIEKANKSLE